PSGSDAGVDGGGAAAVDDAYAGGGACACRASGRSGNGAWGAMLGVAVAMGMAGYRRRRRVVDGRGRRQVRTEG
ncbi:MAG TPA: MYXO-CTERM sorting domain-containing protein, partial [Polyangiaceae bacterium]|nr:MYXO-CTERM sorting domain-containing protein [Polyangiaceae bacterium]